MQLRRLTRVFARRTRRFVKPLDCRRYIRLAKALIRLLMCRLRVSWLIRLFVQVIIGFTMHRPMRDLFLQTITLNILGKVFNRHFEIFLSFFQKIRICISCKLSQLHGGWSGGAKVSCILCHRGVQLILAYSWARPAILVAGKGRGGMFLFLLFLHFHSCSSFFPVSLFHLFDYLFYHSSPFLWEMTQNDPQGLTCR